MPTTNPRNSDFFAMSDHSRYAGSHSKTRVDLALSWKTVPDRYYREPGFQRRRDSEERIGHWLETDPIGLPQYQACVGIIHVSDGSPQTAEVT